MDSEDGQIFIKNLAQFVRTHEKALANALQLRRQGSQASHNAGDASPTQISGYPSASTSSSSSAFAAALSLGNLSFSSQNVKPAKLTLTPHHLFYLLSRFEEIGIPVGPMNIRLESLHAEASPANYVSFLGQSQRSNKGRSDRESIHSVSSVRSVMSGMSSLWANFGLGHSSSVAKSEKAKAQLMADTKYLYSAFTKIPCLRLSPDRKARLIGGYEEFPFDTAVPLLAFKNVSALELCDIDFRQLFGWDKIAEQLRSLTIKRGKLDDPTDLLVGIVLDDMDKRRRRSSKAQSSPVLTWPSSPFMRYGEFGRTSPGPNSPMADKLGHSTSPRKGVLQKADSDDSDVRREVREPSTSPNRPSSSRQETHYKHTRGSSNKIKRSGSASSNSSDHSGGAFRSGSSSNLLSMGILPASKWRFLKHLSLADNSLTSMTASSLAPLANTLHSLDLSSNLFAEIPDCLASLTALRALNLSNCMIESLHSLRQSPLPAITSLNLRSNRLASIAGIERLFSLERLDLRDNRIQDPTELARLTGIPDIREIWVVSNLFTKTHGNYRVTIFNLFRGFPGYTEDVVIDSTGPGYSERKQLRDRVPETTSVPVIKPPVPDLSPREIIHAIPPHHVPSRDMDNVTDSQRPIPHTTQSEMALSSNRRKKSSKRRIVDLSRDESHPVFYPEESVATQPRRPSAMTAQTDTTIINDIPLRNGAAVYPPKLHELDTKPLQPAIEERARSPPPPLSPPAFSDRGHMLANEIQHLNLNGDAYRQKVEALKAEVGSNWLSVLSDEGWNKNGTAERRLPHYLHDRPLRPDVSELRVQSQAIVSGTRTLG